MLTLIEPVGPETPQTPASPLEPNGPALGWQAPPVTPLVHPGSNGFQSPTSPVGHQPAVSFQRAVSPPQCNGSVPPQCNGSVPPQCNGSVPPQCNGIVPPQCNGIVPPQCNGIMDSTAAEAEPKSSPLESNHSFTSAGDSSLRSSEAGTALWSTTTDDEHAAHVQRVQQCIRGLQPELLVTLSIPSWGGGGGRALL